MFNNNRIKKSYIFHGKTKKHYFTQQHLYPVNILIILKLLVMNMCMVEILGVMFEHSQMRQRCQKYHILKKIVNVVRLACN